MSGSMVLKGRVAAKLGDNVDTDVIYPGRYLNITDREKTAGAPVRARLPGVARPASPR